MKLMKKCGAAGCADPEHIEAAVRCVIHQQGRRMSKDEDAEWQLLSTEPRPKGRG